MSSQREVNLFSAIILLAIGVAADRAERTPLWTVWRTDSNRFLSPLSLTSGSISLMRDSGMPLMPVNFFANFEIISVGLKELKWPWMVLRISLVIWTILCLVTVHLLVVLAQALGYLPSWGVSDSEVGVESEEESNEYDGCLFDFFDFLTSGALLRALI